LKKTGGFPSIATNMYHSNMLYVSELQMVNEDETN